MKTIEQKTCLLVILLALPILALAQEPDPDRKLFKDSLVPTTPQLGLNFHATEPPRNDKTLELHFTLKAQNSDDLAKRVALGERISVEEQRTKYGASPADHEALVGWLQGQGFKITQSSPDKTSVYAVGTVAQIAASLKVKMSTVLYQGDTYDVAKTPPSLPNNVAKSVIDINGLQPFLKANRHGSIFNLFKLPGNLVKPGAIDIDSFRQRRPTPSSTPPIAPPPVPPSPATAPSGYMVKHILHAYNGDNLGVTGAGETIAILIDTAPRKSDVVSFWHDNGLTATQSDPDRVLVLNVNDVDPLPEREKEETLDVEWTSGIAPGAKIRVYASGSLKWKFLDKALDAILADAPANPTMHQLSISLGLGETYMAKTEVEAESQKFLQLAAAGINVFVASGDAGATPDESGHDTSGPLQAEYQSSDPFVIGVGGTLLDFETSTNTRKGEKGWAFSGGGISSFFDRPVWQVGTGIPVGGGKRLVPDVSLAAENAYIVYNGSAGTTGGTSWSAPMWAGFCALANEARSKKGKLPLPFLNSKIYKIDQKKNFMDQIAGSNGNYTAGEGYDMVTGLGVPNLKELINTLQDLD